MKIENRELKLIDLINVWELRDIDESVLHVHTVDVHLLIEIMFATGSGSIDKTLSICCCFSRFICDFIRFSISTKTFRKYWNGNGWGFDTKSKQLFESSLSLSLSLSLHSFNNVLLNRMIATVTHYWQILAISIINTAIFVSLVHLNDR